MSTNLTAVLQELWQNTTNLKVLRQLMTTDATYVSLNFDNPELKKVMPWAGTHKGPQALPEVFCIDPTLLENARFQGHRHHRAGTRVASSGSWTGCSYSNLRFCAHLRMGLE